MNQPTVKQITVPLNSTFGVAVKVTKDGEAAEIAKDELSVGGLSAVSQIDGYNIYELSSGDAGQMSRINVEVDKPATVQASTVQEQTITWPSNRIQSKSAFVYLSSFLSANIESLRPQDIEVKFIGWSSLTNTWTIDKLPNYGSVQIKDG